MELPADFLSLGRGSVTTRWGEIALPVSAGPVIALVPFIVIEESSSFNAILERTWTQIVKALLSSYHQMLSF